MKEMVIKRFDKKCSECGKIFKGTWNQKSCSEECRINAWKKYLCLRYEKRKEIEINNLKKKIETIDIDTSYYIKGIGIKQGSELLLSTEKKNKLLNLAKKQQFIPEYKKRKSCEICGSKEKLIAHYVSYYPSEIVTMCYHCHGLLHLKLLAGKRTRPRTY